MNRYILVTEIIEGTYRVLPSRGKGVGIYRRKLSCNRQKEYEKRMKELKSRNTATVILPNDFEANQYCRLQTEYLNS